MIFSNSMDHSTNCFISRRSHLPLGVKTKKWEDRMEKTKKARAIKMLQVELKEEKQAEIQRRREITQERKKAAEEKQRIEEEKAKVRQSLVLPSCISSCSYRWVLEKQQDSVARWVEQRRSTTDFLSWFLFMSP